jgi:hypothetical protein
MKTDLTTRTQVLLKQLSWGYQLIREILIFKITGKVLKRISLGESSNIE